MTQNTLLTGAVTRFSGTLIRDVPTSGSAIVSEVAGTAGANDASDPRLVNPIITFDADLEQNYDVMAELSEHAVEDGYDISDNYRVKPISIRLRSVVTGTPLRYDQFQDDSPGRDFYAWHTLRAIMDDREIFRLVTSIGSFDNMMLVGLAEQQTSTQGQRITPNMEFKQVRVASSQTASIAPRKPRKKSVKATKNSNDGGKKPGDLTSDADKDLANDYISVARYGYDWFKKLVAGGAQ